MILITITKINKWAKNGNILKLIEALYHEDDEIRKAAALSIGRLGTFAEIKHLEEILEDEHNEFVRRDLGSAIQQIKARSYSDIIPSLQGTDHIGVLNPMYL